MNKKILISLSVIGAVAAIAIGGTVAYFSDTETSTGNTFTAGTIDLAVNDQNPLDSAVFTVEDVKPCEETEPVRVTLSNVGTNDGIVDLHILPGVHSEGIDSEPECEAECGPGFWKDNECKRGWGACDALNENICKRIEYDFCYDSNDNGECDEEDIHGYLEPCQNIWLGRLLAGENTRYLWISYHLDENAGNKFQGDTCTFDIEFSLHQLVTGESGVLGFKDESGGSAPGALTYWPGSLMMEVHTSDLAANACYQITLEDSGVCTDTSGQLAAGVQGHGGTFDAGYYRKCDYMGGLMTLCDTGCEGWGVYNPEYAMTDGSGNLDTVFKINVKGEGYGYPGLPSGTYENVRMIIKQISDENLECPNGEQLPWPCVAGVDCYVGKRFTDYNIDFSLGE